MIYLECNMGASGDMLMAALLELHNNPADFINRLNNVGIPAVVEMEKTVKCGITATHIKVKINGQEEHHHHHEHHEHKHHHEHHNHHEHSHNDYHGIEHLVGHLKVSDGVKQNVLAVYKIIAQAESHVHGVSVEQIHFHEVGEMDAVADITGVCMLLDELAPDTILASPVNVGSGEVHCAHGILPVPAPATAHILQNIPIYSSVHGELCTPTGAALLKHFVKEFCSMPALNVAKLGYGAGTKDFPQANCLRAYLGNLDDAGNSEEVVELVCNLDDITPEALAFAQQILRQEGAPEVYTTPAVMKKGRAGQVLTCICNARHKNKMLGLIFKHTTTLGVRERICRRYVLQREDKEVQTKYGVVRVKTSSGFGVVRTKPEYEDIAKIASEQNLSIEEVLKAIPNK